MVISKRHTQVKEPRTGSQSTLQLGSTRFRGTHSTPQHTPIIHSNLPNFDTGPGTILKSDCAKAELPESQKTLSDEKRAGHTRSHFPGRCLKRSCREKSELRRWQACTLAAHQTLNRGSPWGTHGEATKSGPLMHRRLSTAETACTLSRN